MSLLFRIPRGKGWFQLEMTWGHTFHSINGKPRMNWRGEFSIGFHTWWVRPGYHDLYYDGPHPAISLGFVVITWEPWGNGEWIEWWTPPEAQPTPNNKEGEA